MSNKTSGIKNGGLLEERIDLSVETEKKILNAQLLINDSTSNLHDALTVLTSHEKQCRIGNDTKSLMKVCMKILQICKDYADEKTLINTINYLANRRNQKPKAIIAIVQKAIPWVLNNETDKNILTDVKFYEQIKDRKKMVIALRDITFGNISLEPEMAQLSRILAFIKENEGDIAGASDTLKNVNVETFGSLSKREKVNFILEQIRITISNKDYIQTSIVSSKINCKTIAEEGMEEEKIKFYSLMTDYHRHRKEAFELARDYHEIYRTFTFQKKEQQWRKALQNTVIFLTLSPYSNDQQFMVKSLSLDSHINKIDTCRDMINLFSRKEIVRNAIKYYESFETLDAVLKGGKELSEHWKNIFNIRIIEHNIRVAALYYRRIHGNKLAKLLGVKYRDLEPVIADMISSGEICAKIDRPKDIVYFSHSSCSDNTLSNWVSNISSLLHLIDKTTHLIHKDIMTE